MQPTLRELTKKHPGLVDELQAMATRRYLSHCTRNGALPQEPGDFAIQGDDTVVLSNIRGHLASYRVTGSLERLKLHDAE